MIVLNRLRQLLQQNRLACAGGRDNQASLAHADWCHDIDDASADIFRAVCQHQPLLRVEWCQIVEANLARLQVRIVAVDGFDAKQGKVALVFFRWANLASDGGSGA